MFRMFTGLGAGLLVVVLTSAFAMGGASGAAAHTQPDSTVTSYQSNLTEGQVQLEENLTSDGSLSGQAAYSPVKPVSEATFASARHGLWFGYQHPGVARPLANVVAFGNVALIGGILTIWFRRLRRMWS